MSFLNDLFGKSEPSKAVADMPSDQRKYVSVDEQIHNDLHLSCQHLLDLIQEELAPLPYSKEEEDRYKKLSRLGFYQVPEISQYQNNVKAHKDELRMRDFIKHYAQRYPLNKFITEDVVNTLCSRYGLILGEVHRFKGQIPLKNQEEIINFKVDQGDGQRMERSLFSELRRNSYGNFDPNDPHLHIIAPQKMFNLTGAEIKGNRIYEIKDPIVLQPVKGGWLIVTAWGLEASDPEVINPNKN